MPAQLGPTDGDLADIHTIRKRDMALECLEILRRLNVRGKPLPVNCTDDEAINWLLANDCSLPSQFQGPANHPPPPALSNVVDGPQDTDAAVGASVNDLPVTPQKNVRAGSSLGDWGEAVGQMVGLFCLSKSNMSTPDSYPANTWFNSFIVIFKINAFFQCFIHVLVCAVYASSTQTRRRMFVRFFLRCALSDH